MRFCCYIIVSLTNDRDIRTHIYAYIQDNFCPFHRASPEWHIEKT